MRTDTNQIMDIMYLGKIRNDCSSNENHPRSGTLQTFAFNETQMWIKSSSMECSRSLLFSLFYSVIISSEQKLNCHWCWREWMERPTAAATTSTTCWCSSSAEERKNLKYHFENDLLSRWVKCNFILIHSKQNWWAARKAGLTALICIHSALFHGRCLSSFTVSCRRTADESIYEWWRRLSPPIEGTHITWKQIAESIFVQTNAVEASAHWICLPCWRTLSVDRNCPRP